LARRSSSTCPDTSTPQASSSSLPLPSPSASFLPPLPPLSSSFLLPHCSRNAPSWAKK
jgi:hypothetical protein